MSTNEKNQHYEVEMKALSIEQSKKYWDKQKAGYDGRKYRLIKDNILYMVESIDPSDRLQFWKELQGEITPTLVESLTPHPVFEIDLD